MNVYVDRPSCIELHVQETMRLDRLTPTGDSRVRRGAAWDAARTRCHPAATGDGSITFARSTMPSSASSRAASGYQHGRQRRGPMAYAVLEH